MLDFSSVRSFSCVHLFATPRTSAHQASLSITNSWSLLILTSIELVMLSNCPILCHPSPPIFNLSSIRVFSDESVLRIRWPTCWSLSFSISPCNEHLGQISFSIDWLDFLAVQGTLKTLLQHHSSKASILRCSAFFIVQLSHPYMTTGKTTALTGWNFVGKVMSLLFNMLSSVQLLSHVRLFVTPWTIAHQPSLSITNFWSLSKPMSIESVMPSNHLILCHPLLLMPAIFLRIRVFSN